MVRMLHEAVLQAKVGHKMQKSCVFKEQSPVKYHAILSNFLILSELEQERENHSFIRERETSEAPDPDI